MTVFEYVIIGVCGVIAGVCNMLAGGGSLLVVPVMIFCGLPAGVANASLRPAILVQNLAAVARFYRSGVLNFEYFKSVRWLILAAIPAALLGASLVATKVRDEQLEDLIAVVFLGLAAFMMFGKRLQKSGVKPKLGFLLVVCAGFYGGFIQIGVGFILTTALILRGTESLARVHAAKVLIVLFYTMVAMIAFVSAGKINWSVVAVLASGQGIGGWIGSGLAARGSEAALKRIYIVLMIVFAIALFVR